MTPVKPPGKFSRYAKAFKLFSDQPLIIYRGGNFIKIAVLPSTLRQLNREVENNKAALNWEVYPGMVVPLKQFTPFAAFSPVIEIPYSANWKDHYVRTQREMIEISMKNLEIALRAPKKNAHKIIEDQIALLGLDLNRKKPFFSKFRSSLHSGFFSFKIPLTPMHGDFIPSNALIDDDKLMLVDWEYASPRGSILYDWWFLKKALDRDGIYNRNTEQYFGFLTSTLEKLNIENLQFEAFGCAMHTAINLSRSDKRKSDRFQHYFKRLNEIVWDAGATNTAE